MSLVSAPQFGELLSRAVSEPGVISRAYNAFHDYSLGNQLLALVQCAERGIAPGPIATYPGWLQKGRCVRRGEKALVLCMPVTLKRHLESQPGVDDGQPNTFTRFVLRPKWFVLAQTDGHPVDPPPIPDWDRVHALATLGITEEPFAMTDGNTLGYARQRAIAVSPLADLPDKTRFHELAHVVLGHTSEPGLRSTDSEMTPRSLREVEAEAVALMCLEALGLPGAEHCRGYIQNWNERRSGEPIPERSAQRIFKAADQILKAGVATVPTIGGTND